MQQFPPAGLQKPQQLPTQDVPWPHTVAPEKNKDKLLFDAVQRAHLNFVENYPQFLGVAFFALKLAPKLATVCGTLFLLGRFAPYAPLAADTALAVPAHLPAPPGSSLLWATTLASRRTRTAALSGNPAPFPFRHLGGSPKGLPHRYMLGFFPLYGLCWLWFLTELKLL